MFPLTSLQSVRHSSKTRTNSSSFPPRYGSTDGSDKICDKLSECDSRIRVYHTAFHKSFFMILVHTDGVTALLYLCESYIMTGMISCLICIPSSQGKAITFVDSDDWIEPDMYLHMMSFYDRFRPDIISTKIISILSYSCFNMLSTHLVMYLAELYIGTITDNNIFRNNTGFM